MVPMSENKTAKSTKEGVMSETAVLMTDSEVAEVLRISIATLRRHLRDEQSNISKKIRRVDVDGHRRWVSDSVREFVRG